MNLFTTRPQDVATDTNAQAFMMQKMLMSNAFITLAMVAEVNGEILAVKPLVDGFTGAGDRIPKTIIYGVPVWRLQRGASAVIMPPIVGDIGLIAICDRDISGVKATKENSLPGSNRTHNYADAIYLGGVLNAEPSQYVKFSNDGIDIVSPLLVSIAAPSVQIDADSSFSINSPNIILNGPVSQGAGSNSGDFTFAGNITATGEVTSKGVKLSTHTHSGVQSGSANTGNPNV
ncbi:Gp138 family membrane-puncturing spike protein [Pantoea sp. CCBC3-3-1]|uniref:Gp138 family membrane-puncturing spike protein n=1 Tax=Pantoea sp. CCBC3-3-1 TaxID=2490851 RepID=UPI0011BDD306|nr:Gp138 family membrane-puncturing spike protein [Pantoea sp. CCBC3-3-1]